MTSIRFAETPGHKLCRRFCRRGPGPDRTLGEELRGLSQSFQSLDDYAALQCLAQAAGCHPITQEVLHD